MAKSNVTIEIDKSLKDEAGELFSRLGISFSDAIALFLSQCIIDGDMPFKIGAASDDEIESISSDLMKKNNKAYKELSK